MDNSIELDSLTPEQAAAKLLETEADFILKTVRLYAPHIKAFLGVMDPPTLLAITAYLIGLVTAQAPVLGQAFDSAREVTAELIYPYLQSHNPHPAVEKQVEFFFPPVTPNYYHPTTKLIS